MARNGPRTERRPGAPARPIAADHDPAEGPKSAAIVPQPASEGVADGPEQALPLCAICGWHPVIGTKTLADQTYCRSCLDDLLVQLARRRDADRRSAL